MSLENFVPSAEYNKFADENGEDAFIRLNLLYIAMELEEIYSEENNQNGEFDELCEDVLEIYLDEQFDGYNVENIADAIMFIMSDSNYSIKEYTRTYKAKRDKICEELLAYLNNERKQFVEDLND